MSFFKRLRSFQRVTAGLCRSAYHKVTSCQRWRMIQLSGNWTQSALVLFRVGQVTYFFQTSIFDSLYFWRQLTYRDLQYLFGKISNSLTNSISIKRTRRIFNTSYALSKWPHFNRAYVVSVKTQSHTTVNFLISTTCCQNVIAHTLDCYYKIYRRRWLFYR